MISNHQKAWIDRRWRQWEPWIILKCRQQNLNAQAEVEKYKAIHLQRLKALFRHKISWRAIRQTNLDSPTQSDEGFNSALAEAVERRRSRMGRVKGRVSKNTVRANPGKYKAKGQHEMSIV